MRILSQNPFNTETSTPIAIYTSSSLHNQMDVSVSLHDVLKFYISGVCKEALLSPLSSPHPPSSEQLWKSIRQVREVLILLATVMGAFPRKKLDQISRLSRQSLALENRYYRVEKLGEDMAILRQWARNAQDAQWDVQSAVRLLSGSAGPHLPRLLPDLLISAKKPFVVVQSAGARSEALETRLQARVMEKFCALKTEKRIPERAQLEFLPGAEIAVSSSDFRFVAIFDTKRWFVLEARLFGSDFGAAAFRSVLQAAKEDEIVSTAFRVASLARLRQMTADASLMAKDANSMIGAVDRDPDDHSKVTIVFCPSAGVSALMGLSIGSDGDLQVSRIVDDEQMESVEYSQLTRFDEVAHSFFRVIKKAVIKKATAVLQESGMKVFSIADGELLVDGGGVMCLLSLKPKGIIWITCPALGPDGRSSSLVSLPAVIKEIVRAVSGM